MDIKQNGILNNSNMEFIQSNNIFNRELQHEASSSIKSCLLKLKTDNRNKKVQFDENNIYLTNEVTYFTKNNNTGNLNSLDLKENLSGKYLTPSPVSSITNKTNLFKEYSSKIYKNDNLVYSDLDNSPQHTKRILSNKSLKESNLSDIKSKSLGSIPNNTILFNETKSCSFSCHKNDSLYKKSFDSTTKIQEVKSKFQSKIEKLSDNLESCLSQLSTDECDFRRKISCTSSSDFKENSPKIFKIIEESESFSKLAISTFNLYESLNNVNNRQLSNNDCTCLEAVTHL